MNIRGAIISQVSPRNHKNPHHSSDTGTHSLSPSICVAVAHIWGSVFGLSFCNNLVFRLCVCLPANSIIAGDATTFVRVTVKD